MRNAFLDESDMFDASFDVEASPARPYNTNENLKLITIRERFRKNVKRAFMQFDLKKGECKEAPLNTSANDRVPWKGQHIAPKPDTGKVSISQMDTDSSPVNPYPPSARKSVELLSSSHAQKVSENFLSNGKEVTAPKIQSQEACSIPGLQSGTQTTVGLLKEPVAPKNFFGLNPKSTPQVQESSPFTGFALGSNNNQALFNKPVATFGGAASAKAEVKDNVPFNAFGGNKAGHFGKIEHIASSKEQKQAAGITLKRTFL
jgi:hypothetical protein